MRAPTASREPEAAASHRTTNGTWQAHLLLAGALLAQTPAVLANDFPTLARIEYVEECQRAHPGPPFEMRSKCSCALDHIAGQVRYDEFDTLKTASDAMSIGGERGGALRDNPSIRPWIAKLKELQSQAAKACFLEPLK